MRKKKSTNANTEMNMMLELFDKDFKTVVIRMLQQTITNSLETNEKIENLYK